MLLVCEPDPPPDELFEELLPPQADIPAASTAVTAKAINVRLTLIGFASCGVFRARDRNVNQPHRESPRGLSASNRPSPTRLNASTVSSRATPGKTMYHQAVLNTGVASEIIWPQLAVGGRIPTLR